MISHIGIQDRAGDIAWHCRKCHSSCFRNCVLNNVWMFLFQCACKYSHALHYRYLIMG